MDGGFRFFMQLAGIAFAFEQDRQKKIREGEFSCGGRFCRQALASLRGLLCDVPLKPKEKIMAGIVNVLNYEMDRGLDKAIAGNGLS